MFFFFGGGDDSAEVEAREQTERLRIETDAKLAMEKEQGRIAIERDKLKKAEKDSARIHQAKMVNMEQEHKIAQLKAEEDLAKQQQEHEETLKQMQIAAEKADKERKIEQKKEALAKIASIVKNVNIALDNDKDELITTEEALGVAQASLAKNKTDIKEFPNKKVIALDIYKDSKEIDYNKKKRDFERDDEEITKAIEETGQHEDDVGKFLRLTHNLVIATVVTQANANSLDAKLQLFNDLIETVSSDKLTVRNYFADKKMSRFVPILADEGIEDLDDLICNDEEYKEVLELIQNGLEEALEKWQAEHDDDAKNDDNDDKAPVVKLNYKERKTLKSICLQSEKTWIKDQNDKMEITKRSLMSVSSVLGKFFGRCFEGMNQVQEMLSLDNKLNDTQRKAIKMIGNVKDDDVNDNDDDDDEFENARDLWDIDSDVQIYSETQDKWFIGQIVKVFTDDEGEWLNVKYSTETDTINVDVQRGSDKVKALDIKKMIAEEESKNELHVTKNEDDLTDELVVECRALSKAATLTVSVLATMDADFQKDEDTMRAHSLAIGVEDSCKQIISSQGAIRQSVLLAQKIMSFKPSNMKNETTQKLWSSLDEAIIHIFNTALDMVTVSVQYFGFFLLFKSDFQYFRSCYKDDKDPSLGVSCEYIRRDVRKFCAFSREFSKNVERLRTEAMNCIENCVKTKNGYESFDKARESRKRTVDLYLIAKAKVDLYDYELDQKLENYRVQRTSLSGNEKKLQYKQTMLQSRIKQNEEYLKNLEKQKITLDQIIY